MDLNAKLVAAARCGGYLGDLTVEEVWALVSRGHAKRVESTGRWLLTDAGRAAADRLGADLIEQEN